MAQEYPPTLKTSEVTYFPIPIPLDKEYPLILNWCVPFTVSVIDVDEVVVGAGEDEVAGDEEEDGLEASITTLPIPSEKLSYFGVEFPRIRDLGFYGGIGSEMRNLQPGIEDSSAPE